MAVGARRQTMSSWAKAFGPGGANASVASTGVVIQFVMLAAVSVVAGTSLSLGAAYPVKVLGAFALIGACVILLARKHLSGTPFGAANNVTLGRAGLTALLVGLFGERATPGLAWAALATALVVLILDGVDGAVARSRAQESRFGARFDMETDALLILVLAVLALQFAKAGAWVLTAGLLRYAFVAGGTVLPWLGAALPSSRRRQVMCVVQVVSLIVCLAPFVPTPWSAVAAALGIAALVGSFAVDVAWLSRNRRRSTQCKS